MMVGEDSYSVKVFDEEQDCYEVFKHVEDESGTWMVQKARVHKKLQIQRALSKVAQQISRQAKNATSHKKEKA